MKFVALVSHIYYFSVYFYHHRFHFQTDSTAPFYSTVRSGWSFSLLIFPVHLFKPPLALLRYGLLHIPSGLDSCLKFFSELALILGGSMNLCFKLLIGTKVSL
jgi:hypothetical protein